MPNLTENDIFTDPDARSAGLSESLWLQAINEYENAADADPDPSMEKYFIERRIRLYHHGQELDVYVRSQPEDRKEYPVFRMSAFPAQNPPAEDRPKTAPIGQAAILSLSNPW